MHDVVMPFTAWESFYVIVGSSAAALTGLQFVVMALVAESSMKSTTREVDAFGTPTVVHFSVVLFVSAVLSAPWHGLAGAGLFIASAGLFGVVYSGIVIRRASGQTEYKPVLEDWLFHAVFPIGGYGVLLVAGLALVSHATAALFPIAGIALLLLFIGIHNSWDTVRYVAVGRPASSQADREP